MHSNMNNVAFFEIQASQPERLAAFYAAVFGWEFERDIDAPILYYRTKNLDSPIGAVLERPAKTPPNEFGTNAFTCSMQVISFAETEKKILENGGRTAMPKFAVPGKCWQGYFVDSDNNVFGIFEVDMNAA
jgi:predicted enzyme related to lactoylglutathione lyase